MIIFALEKITLDIMFRDFPGGPVVKTLPSNAGMQGVRVWSLVRELGSHMLCGAAKKEKNKR